MKLRVTNKRREAIKDLLESYKTFVEDMDNTIKSIGKKQILIDLVKAAKKDDLWDLWYWFTDAGWYTEDKRRLRQFAIDVIENCYHKDATDSYSITNNHTIENCVFNALHKDKEEYFDGLDEHQNVDLLEYGEETSEDIEMRRMIDVIRRKYKNFDFTSKNMGFSAIKKMYDNVVKENPNILDLDSKKGFKKCIGVIPFNNNFKIMFSDGSEKIYSYQRAFDAGYLSPDLYNDLDREEYDLIQDDILKESVKSKMDELNKRYEDILKFPIHSFRNRQCADDKKSKYVTSFSATVKQSNSNSNLDLQIYKTSLDDLDSELSKIKDKFLNESQLNEVNLVDVMNDSKATDPKRVRLSQSLYSEYSGVDSDGTIMFHTDSQTRENHKGHDQFIFYEGFFNLLDKVDDGDHITQEDVLEIITGDLSLRCTCESFLYWAWAYKSWNNDYGLQKELRAPQRNNVNLDGGACKHLLSVLNLINQSSTLFDKIAKDLDNLFLRYKKQSKTTKKKEEEPKNESQILTEISELHGNLDPYDLADDLLRLSTDIKSLYGKYDTDRSSTKDRDSIVSSLDSIRSFVVNKFGMMGDTTNSPSDKLVTEVEITPQVILDSIDNIYSEIESIYDQEKEVVDDSDRENHLNEIKKIKAFLVKKFKEGKKK